MYGNEPTSPPDIDGYYKAWKIKYKQDSSSLLDSWIVFIQGDWYIISVIHLRSSIALELIHDESRSHELMIGRLNPANELPSIDEKIQPTTVLEPIYLFHQFTVRDDLQAVELVEDVMQFICSRDSLFHEINRGYWMSLIDNTADHIMYGCHPGRN